VGEFQSIVGTVCVRKYYLFCKDYWQQLHRIQVFAPVTLCVQDKDQISEKHVCDELQDPQNLEPVDRRESIKIIIAPEYTSLRPVWF
jgi:hypothetical protein